MNNDCLKLPKSAQNKGDLLFSAYFGLFYYSNIQNWDLIRTRIDK